MLVFYNNDYPTQYISLHYKIYEKKNTYLWIEYIILCVVKYLNTLLHCLNLPAA